jgi:hypothetical protein
MEAIRRKYGKDKVGTQRGTTKGWTEQQDGKDAES